jgi:cellulose synthase/poly-beta-1,6-N-acetylglucosamine synthase-like glycosyltransferase
MKRPWHIGVVIPARNEEALLPRCLESVLAAKAAVTQLATVDVVVVSDSSHDRTAEIASLMLASVGKVASTIAGAVGAARRAATNLALERFAGPLQKCWLANTDADCIVPPDWLLQQVKLAGKGIEAIAGIVAVDSFEEHAPWVRSRFEASYAIPSNGTHKHIHGANLGVRADAYIRAGGWADMSTAEDHDLWHRLSTSGARKQSTSRLQVYTSGRREGRAPNGFAGTLAAHNY